MENDEALFSTAKSKLDQISARFKSKPRSQLGAYSIPKAAAFSPTTEIKDFQIKVSAPEEMIPDPEIKPFEEENTEISINKEEVDKIISRYSSLRDPDPSESQWRSQKSYSNLIKPSNEKSSILYIGSSPKKLKKKHLASNPPLSSYSKPLEPSPNLINPSQYTSKPLTSTTKPFHSHSQSHVTFSNNLDHDLPTRIPANNSPSKNLPSSIPQTHSLFSSPIQSQRDPNGKSQRKKRIFDKEHFSPAKSNRDLSKSMTQHKVKSVSKGKKEILNGNSWQKMKEIGMKRGGSLFENRDFQVFWKLKGEGKFGIFVQNRRNYCIDDIYLKIPYFKGLESVSISPNQTTFALGAFESKEFSLKIHQFSPGNDSFVFKLEYQRDQFSLEFEEITVALRYSILHFLDFEPVSPELFKTFWLTHKSKCQEANFSISSKESFYSLLDFLGFVLIDKRQDKDKFYAMGKLKGNKEKSVIKMILHDHWLSLRVTGESSLQVIKCIISEIKFLV